MSEEKPPPRRGPLIASVTVIVLAAMALGTFLYVFQSLRRVPGEAVEQGRRVLRDLQDVARAFRDGTVTTTFRTYATEIEGTRHLQFAQLRQQATFERRDEATVFWGYVDLPTLVVEASAPVEYTYYVDLDGSWDFQLQNGVVSVTAPEIRFNKPAVDVSELQFAVREGSVLRDEAAATERLRRGITWMALRQAHANIPLVRDKGREQVAEFVRTWLARSFADGDDFAVHVTFRDELPREPGREVELKPAPP